MGIWLYMRPRTCGAGDAAELRCTDSDGAYQILINFSDDRFTPVYRIDWPSQEDFDCRGPTRLYVTHAESGASAKEVFLKKLESAGVKIVQPDDSPYPMISTQPASHASFPEAAMISLLDYRAETGPVELNWRLHMKNGDTLEDLQALVAEVERTAAQESVVNLYLPAVTCEGGLVLSDHAVNLYGSTDGGTRTTFTGTT